MKQILHLDLNIQYELPAVEKLAKGGFRVEFPRYNDIDLLRDFLQLNDAVLFHKTVGGWAIQSTIVVVGGRDRQRILAVFENEPNDVVNCIDRLVDLVVFQLKNIVGPLMKDQNFQLGRLLLLSTLFLIQSPTFLPLFLVFVGRGAECR